jgi:uncharacterized protein YggE
MRIELQRFPWLIVLLLSAAGADVVSAQTEPPGHLPVVVTTGEARIRRAPDRAFVVVAVESQAKTPQLAQQQNAKAMTAVLERLKTAGVPAEAIRTRAYELRPEFDYVDGRQVLRGYMARNAVEVRVDPLERLGEILDVAVGSGATSISEVRFDLKDREAVEREALRRAVADARARADVAAAAAGRTIEGIVRIEDQQVADRPPMPMMAMRSQAAETEVPIAPGEIEITATVRVTASMR